MSPEFLKVIQKNENYLVFGVESLISSYRASNKLVAKHKKGPILFG